MTEITLAQLVQIARRWWWILIIGPLLGALLGWVAASRSEALYMADAKLLLDRSSLSAGQENSANAYNDILAAEREDQHRCGRSGGEHAFDLRRQCDAAAGGVGDAPRFDGSAGLRGRGRDERQQDTERRRERACHGGSKP